MPGADGSDPFARRKTVSRNYWATRQKDAGVRPAQGIHMILLETPRTGPGCLVFIPDAQYVRSALS